MGLKLVSPPTGELISTADAKLYLRVTGSSEDGIIEGLVMAAMQWAEQYMGRKLLTQTWLYSVDRPPISRSNDWWDGTREGIVSDLVGAPSKLSLPLAGVKSITEVSTYDMANQASVFADSNYRLDDTGDQQFLVLNDLALWPSNLRSQSALHVKFTVGYGAAADVPSAIVLAVKQLLAYLYEHRGDDLENPNMPAAAQRLLDPYVLRTL